MDVCSACGYDHATLPRPALAPSLALGAALHAARLTAPGDALRRRPAPDVWSPLEYACHVRDVLGVQHDRVAGAAVAGLLDGLDDAGWARTGVYDFPRPPCGTSTGSPGTRCGRSRTT